MKKYDITLKRLTGEFAEDYVKFVLDIENFSVETIDVESVDKELPTLLGEVDVYKISNRFYRHRVEKEGHHDRITSL